MLTKALLGVTVLAALGLSASPAAAGTLSYTPSIPAEAGDGSCSPKYMTGNCGHPGFPAKLSFRAGPGELNALEVVEDGPGAWIVRDAVALEIQGPSDGPCTRIDGRSARCTQALTSADLGDGDDRATVAASVAADVAGGPGNDTISARTMFGSDGDDVLTGTPLNDTADGGNGFDRFSLGAGDDQVTLAGDGETADGGEGIDRVSYQSSPHAVQIDLTGGPGSDSLTSFERAWTSPYDDSVIGTPGDDDIVSYGGRDRIVSGEGDDRIEATGTIDTGSGDDVIDIARPIYDGDELLGMGPNDTLVRSGSGDDEIQDAMPQDVVLCGAGDDSLTFKSRAMSVWRTGPGCESGEAQRALAGVRLRWNVLRYTAVCPRGDGTLVASCRFTADAMSLSDRRLARSRATTVLPGHARELVVRVPARRRVRARLQLGRTVTFRDQTVHRSRARSRTRTLRRKGA